MRWHLRVPARGLQPVLFVKSHYRHAPGLSPLEARPDRVHTTSDQNKVSLPEHPSPYEAAAPQEEMLMRYSTACVFRKQCE